MAVMKKSNVLLEFLNPENNSLVDFKPRMCVCEYSNSRNEVPRVAQRYGTIAAHTWRRVSVLVVFVVFCLYVYSFACFECFLFQLYT